MASRLVATLRLARWRSHPLAPILLAAIALAAVGLLLPPRSTNSTVGPGLGGGRSAAPLAPSEDLADFRSMARWGATIQSIEEVEADPDAEGASDINSELVKLGFIGLSRSAGEIAVLLTHPNGHIRLTGGDSLPDGRTLLAVTDNDLTLENADGQRQTLALFPRVSAPDSEEPQRNPNEPNHRPEGQTPDGLEE